ncbi:MAG TPA: sulfite exporter TauE/SafE family protein [bacterium]|nr:sulfite exporter TauE/SafE family protein [bacterium]HPN45133.1 sulfite exporter TauE/SafE family protein [bacterium]
MITTSTLLILIIIGLIAGILSGIFGIGGGIVIVPALIYILGFTQHRATGTSLAVLLPPVGLIAVLEYYRHGHVDLKAALIIAVALIIGAWFGAILANKLSGAILRMAFGIFVVSIGFYIIYGAAKKMGWL